MLLLCRKDLLLILGSTHLAVDIRMMTRVMSNELLFLFDDDNDVVVNVFFGMEYEDYKPDRIVLLSA